MERKGEEKRGRGGEDSEKRGIKFRKGWEEKLVQKWGKRGK